MEASIIPLNPPLEKGDFITYTPDTVGAVTFATDTRF